MGNGIFRGSNLKKAWYYLKKNGLKNAYYAALERIMSEKKEAYCYRQPEEEALELQREKSASFSCTFSILVPACETDPGYLREMIDSVLGQTYGKLELILADASSSEVVKRTAESYKDERLRYLPLGKNEGISENTNAALALAKGDYIGLLDHDDVLTPDALFEMAEAIREKEKNGATAWLLYSDEDKGNGDLTAFYEPNFKPELNMDLLLSNNYICHFLVMKKELMKELGFRREYDGAQDYDLILRGAGELVWRRQTGRNAIVHIPRVLYHWRCHDASTAQNPESKRYAYEAGKHALEAFLRERGWRGRVCDTKHLGFYRIVYESDIFAQRKEVGAVCGKLLDRRGRDAGGMWDADGCFPYLGLPESFSGYMHRAALAQEVCAPDLRAVRVRKELWPVFEETFGMPYRETERDGGLWFDCRDGDRKPEEESQEAERCLEFGRRLSAAGYTVVWLPEETVWM